MEARKRHCRGTIRNDINVGSFLLILLLLLLLFLLPLLLSLLLLLLLLLSLLLLLLLSILPDVRCVLAAPSNCGRT